MASRTISTGEDVDAALEFLGKQSNPPTSGNDYFMGKVADTIKVALNDADEKRYNMAKAIFTDEKDKGKSISKLRELLGA